MNIDIARLQKEIDDLSLISEATPPVVTRVLYSEADMKGRAFVKNLFREAGLTIREDAVGNTFARWQGKDKTAAPIGTGSHIDAIPNAGKYDGVVGVLGALEAVRALQKSGFVPQRSIDIIIFTAEEPTRFGIGCLGSRLLAGTLPSEKVANLKDRDGQTLDTLRKHAGFPTSNPLDVRLPQSAYSAFIELHIEQGPILEARGLDIGIVEKIAAPSSLRMKLTGVGGHAGAVLMPERHDAGLAAAEISLAVEKAARTSGSPDTVGTTGVFRIEPGAVNSVPCFAYLEIDLRDTNVRTRDAALVQIESAAKEICQRREVALEIERVNVDAPANCDPKLVSMVEDVCKKQNVSSMRMISRAYHDSLFMAQVAPTTMIFIPCLKGYSHRPDEYSSPTQIRRGVDVLASALRHLSASE
ncbi:MAG: M20 family metallo-hydrolase [Limisphaerales bacterium]